MKKTHYLFAMLFASMIVLGLSACDKDDDDNNYQMGSQDFVTRASSSNMLEIASGQLAINQGEDANVKAFGQHMVNDHGQATAEMTALVAKKGSTVPTAMLPEHQQMVDTLKSLTGAAFDKQFAVMMVTSHQTTVALFEQAAGNNGVPDNDLRAFASGKLPTLKQHLQEAQQLQTNVND
jgi:putative membrane protein